MRAAELEQALLLLPYSAACELLERLLPLLEEAPPAELMTRCVLFVLKVSSSPPSLTLTLTPTPTPTPNQAEISAADCYRYSEGKAIYGSGEG